MHTQRTRRRIAQAQRLTHYDELEAHSTMVGFEAAGFERGWEPCWMAAELTAIPACTDDRVSLTADVPDYGPEGQRLRTLAEGRHATAWHASTTWTYGPSSGAAASGARCCAGCAAPHAPVARSSRPSTRRRRANVSTPPTASRVSVRASPTGTTCAETDQAVPHVDAFGDLVAHDAFGIQLLGPGYTSRLTLGADWRARPPGSDATLVEHVDTDAWYQAPVRPAANGPEMAPSRRHTRPGHRGARTGRPRTAHLHAGQARTAWLSGSAGRPGPRRASVRLTVALDDRRERSRSPARSRSPMRRYRRRHGCATAVPRWGPRRRRRRL
jgi:hypothetical protein